MLPGKKLVVADIVGMIRRRLWLIIIPPFITVLPALLYSSTIKNVYRSDMLIAIDPQRVPDSFVRSTVTMGTEARMQAITVQVRSRTNLQAMIEEYQLYPQEREQLPMEDVVKKMHDGIDVTIERGRERGAEVANAFHILFTYPEPQVAAQVTQKLGSLFVEQNSRDRGSLANATNTFLEAQLADARSRLESHEQKLEEFRKTHGKALPTQMQANLQALQSTQLQMQSLVESLARDRDQQQLLQRLYREAQATPAPPEPAQAAPATTGPNAAGQSTNGGTPEQRLAAARTLLASLELRYQPEHPDIRRTQQMIAQLETQLGGEKLLPGVPSVVGLTVLELQRRERLGQMAAEIESLGRRITFKEAEEKRVRSEIVDYQGRLEAVPGLESEWVALTRDYDTQAVAYKELLAKSGAAKVAVDLEEQQIGEHFRIVDPATVPVHPLPSARLQVNVIGLALGLFLGLGLAALLELRDGSYRSEADVLEVLQMPVLAAVPYLVTPSEQQRSRRKVLALSLVALCFASGAGYLVWSMKLWNSVS